MLEDPLIVAAINTFLPELGHEQPLEQDEQLLQAPGGISAL